MTEQKKPDWDAIASETAQVTRQRHEEAQRATKYRPEPCHGVISLVIEVPASERANPANDIAEAYAVETGDDIPGGCIIWGKYRGEWVANASGRWLISRFLKTQ